MHHPVDALALEQGVKRGSVADIELVKPRRGVHRGGETGHKAVRHYYVAPCGYKFADGVRADVARSAEDKNCHVKSPFRYL